MNQRKTKQVDMLHGSLLDKIFFFALPLALSSILQQLFNSADLAVVGRFASYEAMAAVGSNAAVINLIISLFTGLSVGANVVIATLIGRNEKEKINDAVHTIVSVALLSGLVLIGIGILASKEILILMDAPANVLQQAIIYLRIYFTAMPFIMMYNFGSSILRSKGDSQRPLYCLIASGILNVLLNLLFVIVFQLGVVGVALATVISNALSAGMIVHFLRHEEETFRLSLKKLKIHKSYLLQMMKIGLPAGIQGMVFSLSNVVIQSGINSFGAEAIAGSTAAQNFEFMAYFVVNAFSQAAVTFTSQNYGARDYERCKRVFLIAMLCGECITFAFSMTFWFGRQFFLSFFTTDPKVLTFAMTRMFWISNFEIGTGTYEISGGCLRGMGKSMTPTILTLIGSCLFRLLYVTFIFSRFNSFETLLYAYPLSWVITGSAVLIAYFKTRRALFAQF